MQDPSRHKPLCVDVCGCALFLLCVCVRWPEREKVTELSCLAPDPLAYPTHMQIKSNTCPHERAADKQRGAVSLLFIDPRLYQIFYCKNRIEYRIE